MTGWGPKIRRRRTIASVLFVAVLAELFAAPAEAVDPPSLKLIDIGDDQRFVRNRRSKPVRLDLSTLVASVGGAFELRATRADTYDGPITLRQVDAHDPSTTLRLLDASLMDGWSGLVDFFEVTVTDANALPVYEDTLDWCPNGFSHERTSDEGPILPTYPRGCSGHPFTLGTVWGVDAGWAVETFEQASVHLRDGTYDVTLAIAEPYRTELGVAVENAEIESALTVKTKRRKRRRRASPASQRATFAEKQASHVAPPDDPDPDPATLPDLRATPAWAIGTHREDGKDLLTFAATEWNAGPQPMVIEGFRDDTSTPLMTAYQYFYENGQPVGRDAAGFLAYETHDDHDHWHFQQFVVYELLDETDAVVSTSGKQAWCLVPNAVIDLTVSGANWRPGNTDLSTACGHRKSLWIREILDVGHGDTYFQFSGEAFDVTHVPDGDYKIRIRVNPEEVFHESNLGNNESLRSITLGGSPGARTVSVAPVGLIED